MTFRYVFRVCQFPFLLCFLQNLLGGYFLVIDLEKCHISEKQEPTIINFILMRNGKEIYNEEAQLSEKELFQFEITY